MHTHIRIQPYPEPANQSRSASKHQHPVKQCSTSSNTHSTATVSAHNFHSPHHRIPDIHNHTRIHTHIRIHPLALRASQSVKVRNTNTNIHASKPAPQCASSSKIHVRLQHNERTQIPQVHTPTVLPLSRAATQRTAHDDTTTAAPQRDRTRQKTPHAHIITRTSF